jgi:hypothetical protein
LEVPPTARNSQFPSAIIIPNEWKNRPSITLGPVE